MKNQNLQSKQKVILVRGEQTATPAKLSQLSIEELNNVTGGGTSSGGTGFESVTDTSTGSGGT